MKILNPAALPTASQADLAPRPASLEGLTVGILVNGKEHSHTVMDHLANLLYAQVGFAKRVEWNKGFPAKPAQFLDEIAKTVDVVLNGVGH